MKRHSKPVFLAALSLLATAALAAPPAIQQPASQTKPPTLTVDLSKSITSPTPAEAIWDFGRRKVAAGDLIEHVFTLRNPTKSAIEIDSLLTSCHCTTATLLRPAANKASDAPFTLLPGKAVSVRVSIDVDQAHAVDFRKMVWVYVKGADDPAFTLTVAGTMTADEAK